MPSIKPNSEVWPVLKKIRDKFQYLNDSTSLTYGEYCGSEDSSLRIPPKELVALKQLERLKVIEILPPKHPSNPYDGEIMETKL